MDSEADSDMIDSLTGKLVVFKLILCSGLLLGAFSYTSIGLESPGTKLSYSIPLCLSFNLACVQYYNMGTLSTNSRLSS